MTETSASGASSGAGDRRSTGGGASCGMHEADRRSAHRGADILGRLDAGFRSAIAAALGAGAGGGTAPTFDGDPQVRPAQNPQFGDFQCNAAMALAKATGMKPRELAQRIVEAAASTDLAAIAEPLEIAGPGFINVRLRSATLAALLDAMDGPALGVEPVVAKHAIVVDLCGVNVAKQLHVGHLRATVIGDTLARLFERLGRVVHRQNHLGDWGLPIAMVLHVLREQGADLDALSLDDLNRAYRSAQQRVKSDAAGLAAALATGAGPHRIAELTEQNEGAKAFEEAAKETLVRLQSGDPELERDWKRLISVTMREVAEVVRVLNVKVGEEHSRGESSFRGELSGVVDAFVRGGLAREDDGAIVVPFPDRERPLLIRKRDGGYLYATTDLAAVRHRVQTLDGERVIYVVDARQRDHFRDVFDAAAMIGWTMLPDGVRAELVHIGFGTVLGADRRPLKTRSGENFTLMALLQEAISRARAEVHRRAEDESSPTHGLSPAELDRIGQAVGIAAIKYADLGSDVVRDYVFDLDRMVSFDGDTGPYLLYAHARTCSILNKAAEGSGESLDERAPLLLEHPAERQLALTLLRYPQTLTDVARSLEPHRLCGYLHSLAESFASFFTACPVLKAEDPRLRASRLRLCDLVRRVLHDGLETIGIEAPQRM